MEVYAQALNFAIPFFFTLIIAEHLVAKRMGMAINRGADMISSLSSGITNTVKDVLGISIAIISYDWLVQRIAIYNIQSTLMLYVVAFVAKDFAGYWIHRFEHEINLLWNRHVVHHSSEEFNLACALRQSISAIVSFFGIFMLPAALLGVPTSVIAIVAPLHLFAQFWYHTRTIDRLGWLESFLVTPSHHRVHHAINPRYIDKNYGQVFILWDKWFGTFQPELPEEPPVYGIRKPARTWNPIIINFQHLWLLIQDAWHANSWWDKLRIWFMPTGWRPADVEQKYPVQIITEPGKLEKYDTGLSYWLLIWSWTQFVITTALAIYMFNQIAAIGAPGIFFYGLFLFLSVYSFATLMDKNSKAVWYELIRLALGFGLIEWYGDWFGLDRLFSGGTLLIALYLGISSGLTIWFVLTEVRSYVSLQHESGQHLA